MNFRDFLKKGEQEPKVEPENNDPTKTNEEPQGGEPENKSEEPAGE